MSRVSGLNCNVQTSMVGIEKHRFKKVNCEFIFFYPNVYIRFVRHVMAFLFYIFIIIARLLVVSKPLPRKFVSIIDIEPQDKQ